MGVSVPESCPFWSEGGGGLGYSDPQDRVFVSPSSSGAVGALGRLSASLLAHLAVLFGMFGPSHPQRPPPGTFPFSWSRRSGPLQSPVLRFWSVIPNTGLLTFKVEVMRSQEN